jgi:hypothetical protein
LAKYIDKAIKLSVESKKCIKITFKKKVASPKCFLKELSKSMVKYSEKLEGKKIEV